jgi:hypothetical protein
MSSIHEDARVNARDQETLTLRPARVTVLETNASSLALCARIGFVPTLSSPPFVVLEWRPPSGPSS